MVENVVYLNSRCYIFTRIWCTQEMSPLFTLVSNAKTLSMNIYQRWDKRQTIYYCHALGPSQASGLLQSQQIQLLILIIYTYLCQYLPSTSFTFFVLWWYWLETGTLIDNVGRGILGSILCPYLIWLYGLSATTLRSHKLWLVYLVGECATEIYTHR